MITAVDIAALVVAVLSVIVAVAHLLHDRRKLSNEFFSDNARQAGVDATQDPANTAVSPLQLTLDPILALRLDQTLALILERSPGQIASLRRELAATRDEKTVPQSEIVRLQPESRTELPRKENQPR